MSLTLELLKNCTSIIELYDVNELFSNLRGEPCGVYALRAEFGYPQHLIPPNTYNFIAYIGISKTKIDTSYGQAQFINFYYEPEPIGVLEHFFDIYLESEKEILKEINYKNGEEFSVELFPNKITKKNLEFWKNYLNNEYDVNDKISLDDFLDDYEIKYYTNYDKLQDSLPNNIDDLDNESEYETEPDEDK